VAPGRLGAESAAWLRALRSTGSEHERAAARLHELVLGIAQAEVRRRGGRLRVFGPELDDLAHQAAADAVLAIVRKLDQFRGESRFTTWAYKFVMFEVSSKIGRHVWRTPSVSMDAEDWERLPDRFGLEPVHEAEWRDLVSALRRAVDDDLTARQRRLFVAIVLNGVPLDAMVIELDTNRNAIYKTLFDARRSSPMGIWTKRTRGAHERTGSLPAHRSARRGMRRDDGTTRRLRRVDADRRQAGAPVPGRGGAPARLRSVRGGPRGLADRAARLGVLTRRR
jgi:RNA polymerase sigma-70 factor (ECF subfamily)